MTPPTDASNKATNSTPKQDDDNYNYNYNHIAVRSKVTRFSAEFIENHRSQFNTCNLSTDRPDDYWQVINAPITSGWIDQFHNDKYRTFVLPAPELRWIQDAIQVGSKTGAVPKTYAEEFHDCCDKYESDFRTLVDQVIVAVSKNEKPSSDSPPAATHRGGVFVRGERVSLKAGLHRVGPYHSLRPVLESIVTTTLSHALVQAEDTECRLFLLPWQEMDADDEFRVFVCDHQITGISQQVWSQHNEKWGGRSDEALETLLVRPMLDFFHEEVRDKLRYLGGNYTLDVCFLQDNSLYLIEPNCFGAAYAAGSSLFHWELDEETLSDSSVVEIRIVDRR